MTEQSSLQLVVKIRLVQIRCCFCIDLIEQAWFSLQPTCVLRSHSLLKLNDLRRRDVGLWAAVLVNVIVDHHEPDIYFGIFILYRLEYSVRVQIDGPVNPLMLVRKIEALVQILPLDFDLVNRSRIQRNAEGGFEARKRRMGQ